MANLKTIVKIIGLGKTFVDIPELAFQTVIAVHRNGTQYHLVPEIPTDPELLVHHNADTGRLTFPAASGYVAKSKVHVIYRA